MCPKLVEEAKRGLDREEMPDGSDQDARNILYDIACGELEDGDWEAARKGLQTLMTREEQRTGTARFALL